VARSRPRRSPAGSSGVETAILPGCTPSTFGPGRRTVPAGVPTRSAKACRRRAAGADRLLGPPEWRLCGRRPCGRASRHRLRPALVRRPPGARREELARLRRAGEAREGATASVRVCRRCRSVLPRRARAPTADCLLEPAFSILVGTRHGAPRDRARRAGSRGARPFVPMRAAADASPGSRRDPLPASGSRLTRRR
jgi:hypothetical protein